MKTTLLTRVLTIISSTIVALTLSGCAGAANPEDRYEAYNRKVFKFNSVVDKVVYRPVAKVYDTVTPKFVRRGVHNVFANIDQVPHVVNDVLQLNIPMAMRDIGRLGVNTTLGLGGWFDVARHMGAPNQDQDFGLTLAYWGWKDSTYLLLPFLPIGTVRDFIGYGVDYSYFSPLAYIQPSWVPLTAYAVWFVDKRAALLPADQLIKESFDPYIFVRDAYLQKRKALVSKLGQPYGQDDDDATSSVISTDNVGNTDTAGSTNNAGGTSKNK